MKSKLLTIFLLFFCTVSYAKHITGGEMIYDFVSATSTTKTYRITLILFRDENCFNCAVMPPIVTIGIFNNDNNEPYGGAGTSPTLDVDLNRTEILPITSIPLCITNQPTLNYTAGYYVFLITLDNNSKGYTAAYQTCCRIDNINNIVNNGTNGVGATYTTNIPGSNILRGIETDNSARFAKGISIVCYNNSFSLDFSATDPDGDQLVYSLCDAYNGGAAQNASNITPSVPPYGSLTYSTGFSGIRPLGPQSTINAQTGIISGIAPQSGKYVVSVCVSSYRNGKLMDVHRKDFIITVAPCDFANADLLPDYITCDGFSFQFSNISQSPLNQTFYWDFNDPLSGANNISTSPTPFHTFSVAGDYIVKFIVNKGTPCVDSTTTIVKVYPGYFPAFNNNSPMCKAVPVQFTDLTTANYGAANSWHWDFGINGVNSDTSNIQNPTYSYPQPGNYTATLIVGSSKGCIDTITKSVTIVDKPVLTVTNDTLICSVDNLQLSIATTSSGTVVWTPNFNINNVTSFTPIVSPNADITYYVDYSDNYGCRNNDSVRVRVVDVVTLIKGIDTTICRTDPVTLNINSNALIYSWTPSSTLNNASIKNPIATPIAPVTTYYVKGNIGSCFQTDSINIFTVPYPLANAGLDTLICWGSSAYLNATGGSSYTWSPANFLNDSNISNPVSITPTVNFIDYIVTVSDVLGCPKPVKDTVRVTVENIIADAGPRDTSIVSGQPLQLNATGSTIFNWTPNQWLNNPNISNPISLPQDNIEYIVMVSNSVGCFDVDTIRVHYYKVIPGFFVPTAFSPNGDGVNDIIKPIALGLKSIDIFSIYNRWGQLIFTTSQIGEGWDGKFKGVPQEMGTYVWYAKGTDYANKKLQKKGSLVLVR